MGTIVKVKKMAHKKQTRTQCTSELLPTQYEDVNKNTWKWLCHH